MQIGGRGGELFVSNKHARLLRSDRQIARLPFAPRAIKRVALPVPSVQLLFDRIDVEVFLNSKFELAIRNFKIEKEQLLYFSF